MNSHTTPPDRRLRGAGLNVIRAGLALLASFNLPCGVTTAFGAADLYMQDTPSDMGMEPNPDSGPMWVTEDIWVRQNPIPGYQPLAFSSDPAWLTTLGTLHQNPEYRDPKSSKPNYVYVRVRNRGTTASSGNERLRLYWAKASTGLSWPAQWVDYIATHCGPSKLYGLEITKPRRNAADVSVPLSELNEYRDAIVAIGTTPALQFPGGVSYWHKQQTAHSHVVSYGGYAHGSHGFLPWHREFIARYEILLREANPRVTLFYWDWTTDPRDSARITGSLGTFSGTLGAPFDMLFPPTISRFTGTHLMAPTPTSTTDATVVGATSFPNHSDANETPHNRSHGFGGGTGGNLTSPSTSTQDPFFFLLHGNADRLWAMWQRQNPSRYDPATAYTGSVTDLATPMAPWNGLRYNGTTASMSNPAHGIQPWTTADGYILQKPANDPSVIFPPIYDTAPLRIPPLAAGQSVVIEIPWYPPNPADFACFGTDQGHVCLLARIETSTSSPFGMAFMEGTDVFLNTKNNNNIVWKNITVQDMAPGFLLLAPIWLRNVDFREVVPAMLRLRVVEGDEDIFRFGNVMLDLKPELFQRWLENGAKGQGFERGQGTALQLFSTDAFLDGIPLLPGEVQQVDVSLQLRLQPPYPDPQERVFRLDLEQRGAANDPTRIIGGQRFVFDFTKLRLVRAGAPWRYWDQAEFPGVDWFKVNYDDAKWKQGSAELGYGDGDETTVIESGPEQDRHITTWFRHRFDLEDPFGYRSLVLRLKAGDGAVVYLNGEEIHRLRMPAGAIQPDTLAAVPVESLEENTFYPVDLSNALELLNRGINMLAVEVHQASPRSPTLSFDLDLCANWATPRFKPAVKWRSPRDGSLHLLGKSIPLAVEAVSPDQSIASITFFAGNKTLGRVTQPPFQASWDDAPAGPHQICALALDSQGQSAEAFLTIQVLENLPPLVRMTQPGEDQMFLSDEPIEVMAEAEDLGGSVRRVDFYVRTMAELFGDPVLMGSRDTPPYAVTLRNLPPGHQVLTAVAIDNEGATTTSAGLGIHVEHSQRPHLTIHYNGTWIEIHWMPPDAILQRASSIDGEWHDVLNVQPPLLVDPSNTNRFYRARTQ